MLRITPALDDYTEAIVHQVIGCCIAVHRELGPGLLEGVYRRALAVELRASGLLVEAEKQVPVSYRGVLLCRQRLDLVLMDRVLVELKSVERLAPIHHAQVLSYLRVSKLRIGLLVNFNVRVLPDGLKRIVL